MLSAERLRERLDYNPTTGCFTWLDGKHSGMVAGCLNAEGRPLYRS